MIKFKRHRQMEFRELLVHLVKLLEPEVYCEIGTKDCYTFNAITPLVDYAVGVDPAGIHKAKGSNFHLFEMTSDDFAHSYKGPKIDFLFIDGDHSRAQVMKDIRNLRKFVQDGTGLIFLHDTYPTNPTLEQKGYCHDAWKAADFYHTNGAMLNLEIVTIPGPYAGISIMRKRGEEHLHWK